MGAEDEDRREMLFLFYLFLIVDSKHLEKIFKSARWQSYELDYSKKERTMETFPGNGNGNRRRENVTVPSVKGCGVPWA